MMESENVIVVVRIRPIQKSEELKGENGCVAPVSSGKEVQVRTGPLAAQVFKCNGCFPRDTTQEDFFDQSGITDLLDSAMGGYRASTFAFGQTGAGKTFTCFGPSDDGISPGHPDEGLLGRSLKYLFEKLTDLHVKFNLRISCYEIYHENVFDLFAEDKERAPLGVREHSTDGFFLVGCKLINCPSYKVACNAVGYAIQNRQVGHHDLNTRSSRSHCITEIYIDLPGQAALMSTAGARAPGLQGLQREMEAGREYLVMGRMTFVDLAGSERLKTTQSTGKVLHEAGFINRSLYVLGKVIAGLVRTGGDLNHRDVPYRDSKLTKLLIGSLGGRTRTLLMACVTEASGSQAETLRTLKFSMSCARIRNRPVRFLDPQVKLILELRGEIKRLKDENSQLRTSIQTVPSDLPSSYIEDGEEMLNDNPYNEEYNNNDNNNGNSNNNDYDDDDDDDEVMYNNNNNNSYKNGRYQEYTDSYNDNNHRHPLDSNSVPQDKAITQPQNKGGGPIIREGINRKSQSLAELRADASAYAYNQDGEQDNEDMNYYPHPNSNKKSPNQKINILKKQYNRNIEISSDKRKSQTKFTSRVGGLKPFKKGSEVTSYELGTPMSDLRSAILMAKKKKWIGSGGKLDDFNEDFMPHDDNQERGMDVHNIEALHHHHHNNYHHDNRHTPLKQTPIMSSEGGGGLSQLHGGNRVASNDIRGNIHGQCHYSDNEIGPSSSSPAPSSYSPQPHNNGNSNGDGRIHDNEYETASNSGSGSNRIGAAAVVASSEPYVSGMTRATSASSGYTDDGFDDYADPDEPDQEGAALSLSLTPQLSPKSLNEESPKQIYGRAPIQNPDPYNRAPIQNPDTNMRYSTDQHRLDVQRLSDDAEKERRAIEDKLFQLRESDVIRSKLKEQDDNLNSKNQYQSQSQNLNYNQNNYSSQHQYPQQQQQQQHQYPNNYHNNHLNNYENNFQIMEQNNGPNRQLQLQQHITHTNSSSKSNSNNNNHNHPYPNPHERYVGMIKSDSKSSKTRKLKSVVEVTRKIIKKKINGHSAPSYTAPVPWNDRPMVEKKLERRVREKERSDEAAARDTGNNRAPPGIARLLKGAEIIKMPPQLRGSGKGSDNRDSTRNGRAVPGNQRDRDRGSSESDYDEAVGEEKSNRFLPYITAQPSRSGRNILDNKKRLSSDPRLRSMHTDTHTNGTDRDRGRAQTDDNVRSGRQRSVSAENRINKVSNIDPRGARNALRVSTSPTLHQHRTGNEGEGNHEDRSVRDTQMKLFLLERKLKEQRQFMEDNPGDVTCESEELISALEEEVKSMRTDFTAASGPKSNGRTGPRGLGGWRDDRDKCRISQKQEQEHEHALGLSQGEDEVKEMSRDKFSPRGITDSETSFRSPQPPTQPSGGVVRDGTTPVSRKDMTQGRLNHNINQQKKGSSYVPALRDKALRSGSDTHDEHTDGDLIPEDGRDLPIRDKDCPTASPLSPDAKTAEDIDESSHGYDDDAYEDEDDFIAPEHEHKVDPKDDISVLTSTDAGSKALSANPRGAETSNILNGFKKNLKGDFSDQSITPSNPITSIPVSASASTSTSQAYPLVSQPVHAPPVPRPATKGPPSLAEIRRLKEEKLLQQEKEDKEKADSAPPVTLPVHVPVSTYKDSEAQGGSTSDSYSLPGKADNGTKNQSYKIPQIQAEESGGYVPSTQARVKRSDVSKEKEKEIEKEIFYVKETKKDKEKEREKEKEKDTDEMYCAVKVKEKDKKTDYNEDDDDDDDMYINVKNKKENGDKPSWNVKEKVIVKEKDKEKEVEKEKEKKTDNWNKNVKSSWDTEKVVEGKSKVEEKEKEVDLKYVTQTPKGGQFQGGNYEEKVPLQVKKPGTFSQYGNSKRVGDDYDDAYEFNGSDDEIA